MEQTRTLHFPKEIHTHIYSLINDIKAQDRLRSTCKDWKEIGDKLAIHSGLLQLLHSLPHANKETKTRILFYAIYTNDDHLTKRILESTSEQLYTIFGNNRYVLDPYHLAQKKNNEKILTLLKQYHHGKPHQCSQWPQDPVEEVLLLAAISGDNITFENILHANFNEKNVFPRLGKNNPTLSKYTHLKESFYIVTEHDDELCIQPCMQWIKNNPQFTFLNILLLDEALKKKRSKVYTKILTSYKDLNAIETCYINGIKREQTLKDKLLWNKDWREQSYYQEAEKILNSFGAKTAQELRQQKAPLERLQASNG
jgi:hypothetical protein